MTDTIMLSEQESIAFQTLANQVAESHLTRLLSDVWLLEEPSGVDVEAVYDRLNSSRDDWRFILSMLVQVAIKRGDFTAKVTCVEDLGLAGERDIEVADLDVNPHADENPFYVYFDMPPKGERPRVSLEVRDVDDSL